MSKRRRAVGAERIDEGVHFRVWAPEQASLSVVIEDGPEVELEREEHGYFSILVPGLSAGARYRFRIGDGLFPDPASRFQPEGPHGPSMVVDPTAFPWTDKAWPGVTPDGQVLYEMHIGTFTKAGTYEAALRELPKLKEVGVTLLEVMPVSEFAG